MRCSIYPPGKTAHNSNPSRDEFPRQPSRMSEPPGCGSPRSNYRDSRHCGLKLESSHEKTDRRRMYLTEKLGIISSPRHHEPRSASVCRVKLRLIPSATCTVSYRSESAAGRPHRPSHNGSERAKARPEPLRRHSPHTISQKNCQSSFPFIHPTTPVPVSLLLQRINFIDEGTHHALEFLQTNARYRGYLYDILATERDIL